MSVDESVARIHIVKEIPFFGNGDSLQSRLKKVVLRGFDDVRIYENAIFSPVFLEPDEIMQTLHTPQPNVYQNILDRVSKLASLFTERGIDILNLNCAYDFDSEDFNGNVRRWTMSPPIVERFHIPRTSSGGFDYNPLICDRLRTSLSGGGLDLNPLLADIKQTNEDGWYNLINDGTHRVHLGFLRGGIKVFRIGRTTAGFPYYSSPQPYSAVQIFPREEKDMKETKIHIVKQPGHKLLYRLFPSGGIMSGDVRPPRVGEEFI